MANPKYSVYAAQCPTRQALDRIADKWTALIVGLLSERTLRFANKCRPPATRTRTLESDRRPTRRAPTVAPAGERPGLSAILSV